MENKPKRGCFLTGWLWLSLIGSLFGMFTILGNNFMIKNVPNMPAMPLSQQIINTIISIVFLVSIIGIMRWEKVFVYSYGGASLISFVYSFVTNEFSIPMVIGAVIGLLINLWVVYALLKLFKQIENNKEEL